MARMVKTRHLESLASEWERRAAELDTRSRDGQIEQAILQECAEKLREVVAGYGFPIRLLL